MHSPQPDKIGKYAAGLPVTALAKGYGTTVVSDILNVTSQSVRNWAQWWEVDGIVGILDGHKGGRPAKLTAEMLETGKNCACAQPMTLHEIAAEIRAANPAAQAFSLGRLAIGLKACGMSFKRTRLALKENATPMPSPEQATP